MRRLLSYTASLPITSFGLLILRIGFGGLLLTHGYDKMVHYNEMSQQFMPFMGLSASVSLGLLIFAEFFCSLFVIVGLLTRFACVPIIIAMSVALFMAHGGDITGKGQPATLFLLSFLTLLFTGPGKYSMDAAFYKH
jgi:putative oxidoreductase